MKAESFAVEIQDVADPFFAKVVLRRFVGKPDDRTFSKRQFDGSRVLSIFVRQVLVGGKWASENACCEMSYSGGRWLE